ncbi:MAG: hypothetical protein IKN95_11370 [Lachnospiraceae bacterium]|nr:hypothetical protein [Lachnospiraceae bacterium]
MNIDQIVGEMKKIDALVSDHQDSMTRIGQMLSEIASEARFSFGDQQAGQDLAFTANSAMQLCNRAQSSFNSVRTETKDYICQLKK